MDALKFEVAAKKQSSILNLKCTEFNVLLHLYIQNEMYHV